MWLGHFFFFELVLLVLCLRETPRASFCPEQDFRVGDDGFDCLLFFVRLLSSTLKRWEASVHLVRGKVVRVLRVGM